jgi:hypothetical protein
MNNRMMSKIKRLKEAKALSKDVKYVTKEVIIHGQKVTIKQYGVYGQLEKIEREAK